MSLPIWAKNALKVVVLVTTIVAAKGPGWLSDLTGVLPPAWLQILSTIVAIAGALHLLYTESPSLTPLLATRIHPLPMVSIDPPRVPWQPPPAA